MKHRRGEKVGWTFGWFGGFVWLLILSMIWLFNGQVKNALAGIGLFTVAVFCILWFAPWRYPRTRYWLLLLPIYAAFLLSIFFAYLSGGFSGYNVSGWSLFLLCPLLTPFATMGKRTWDQ